MFFVTAPSQTGNIPELVPALTQAKKNGLKLALHVAEVRSALTVP